MENKFEIIKQLIEQWEKFEYEAHEEHNLLNFSEWMTEQIKEKQVENFRVESRADKNASSIASQYLDKFDPKTRFQEYIIRIARFEEFYTRKYLADLPLNSRLEYIFLFTVDILENARKTDLINMHLVEYTTGMDTINRLIRNNLLHERPDQQDKRAKLLTLTVEGEAILKKANKRIEEARTIFLACISPNKWKKTLSTLKEIEEFHNNIYLNHYDKPYAEISNLVDSLKHLY